MSGLLDSLIDRAEGREAALRPRLPVAFVPAPTEPDPEAPPTARAIRTAAAEPPPVQGVAAHRDALPAAAPRPPAQSEGPDFAAVQPLLFRAEPPDPGATPAPATVRPADRQETPPLPLPTAREADRGTPPAAPATPDPPPFRAEAPPDRPGPTVHTRTIVERIVERPEPPRPGPSASPPPAPPTPAPPRTAPASVAASAHPATPQRPAPPEPPPAPRQSVSVHIDRVEINAVPLRTAKNPRPAPSVRGPVQSLDDYLDAKGRR